ncbi:MAG: dTDP-glucose 4,6-dehydratase [Elsteraceae bacterium]
MKLLVTGGSGFIGSALIRLALSETGHSIVNLDKLTYAANPDALAEVEANSRYAFVQADIGDRAAVDVALKTHQPDAILHLAAESHVDRSIDGPAVFLTTNVVGTFTLLEAALEYWRGLPSERAARFRFQHISTDEVFGSLGPEGRFSEETAYAPNSPYSASKAASDHFVRAWGHSFGLPVVTTNCSNNYGYWQFPEKLIPLVTINAALGLPLPVYGKGDNIRDWLYVDDHARALLAVLERGRIGETYAVGGDAERTNLEVVHAICDAVDRHKGMRPEGSRRGLITYVTDRPGHDKRYAIDATKIRTELGWRPLESFETGLDRTVAWYLNNEPWWRKLRERYAGQRLGLKEKK